MNLVITGCMHVKYWLIYIGFTILLGVENSRQNTFQPTILNGHQSMETARKIKNLQSTNNGKYKGRLNMWVYELLMWIRWICESMSYNKWEHGIKRNMNKVFLGNIYDIISICDQYCSNWLKLPVSVDKFIY